MALPYILSNTTGDKRLILNRTFFLADHTVQYGLGMVNTPRSHGGRALDRPFLQPRTLVLKGYVGGGRAGGALPFGQIVTTPAQFLNALHDIFGHVMRYHTGILDYRNGWIQYVRPESIRDMQMEGNPDLREITITLQAEDPLGYSLQPASITRNGDGESLEWLSSGNAPSYGYKLRLRSGTTSERGVILQHFPSKESMTLTVPARTGPILTVNGFQREVFYDTPLTPAWSRWGTGSRFFECEHGVLNTINVIDPDTRNPLTSGNLTATNKDVQLEIVARSAQWLPDSVLVPTNLPGAEYDLSQYDVDVYG